MIEDVKQGILYMASTGQPIPSGELKLMRKDSSLVDVYSTHTIIQIPGKPQELFCIDIDLTERKRAEEEILLLNRELENRVEERTTELQVTMERLQDTNIELQTLNDQVMNDSNRIMNLNEELMDSHNQLQEALATKDRFFAIIAHDLRNPFVALLNNTELLENYFDKLSNDEKTKLIGQIRNASKHTFLLLENLLLWAQSQKGSIKFMPVVIDLYDLVLKNKLIFQGQFTSKEIKIQIDIPVNAIVYADKEMINTILRNLISNAIKFTANGGLIEIGIVYSSEDIKSPSDYITESVKIYVKDSGIGMDSEIKSKLFKIDEKSSRKGTVGETGTGLGLILCKEFVEKHGGRIWVESEVGKGSTFWFSLPK
jgi:signal transduction histidine kinase